MIRALGWTLALSLVAGCASVGRSPDAPRVDLPPFRVPAVPLFVQTPYLNTWLCGDRLADEAPKLWNGQVKGMAGMLKIDGKGYRFLGLPSSPLPALKQDSVRVLPTRTIFEFSQEDVRLRLEFLSPTDPRDLRLLSLPVGLLRAEVSAEKPRSVQLYFDVTGEWAVGSSDRRITWDGLFRIRPSQPRLFRETYNYPDWGELHWVPVDSATSEYGVLEDVRQAFLKGGSPKRDTRYPRAANDEWPVFAHSWDLGKVDKPVVRRLVLGHARRDVVDFYGYACPAYWTRHYSSGSAMIASVVSEFELLRARAAAIDTEVVSRAHAAGGPALACLAALSFRQTFAASELALYGDRPFYFTKSMDLSGASAIQSLELIYPASTALLAFNPALLKMQLAPIFEALRRGDWREPQVMPDLGAYPVASGAISGAVPRPQSTAELALLARMAGGGEGSAELQKPLLALAESEPTLRSAFALGPAAGARLTQAFQAPRDAVRLDLFVDRYLQLGMAPPDAASREVGEVRGKVGKYGAPFDARKPVVRVDSMFWIAALAERQDREAIAAAALRFYADTAARVPAPDQFEVDAPRPVGTQARPVLGAVFAPVLLHEAASPRK
ncbi:MAG TPA: DUF5127 domain-containing protein [Planctomycetota bacterium]|nr:DUF5127 domain-containing protein [Planctomycetota bacterium]